MVCDITDIGRRISVAAWMLIASTGWVVLGEAERARALDGGPNADFLGITHQYDIDAASLDAALVEFSLISGVDLIYADHVVAAARIERARLIGSYGPEDGLDALLAGSGIESVWQSERLAILRLFPTPVPFEEAVSSPLTVPDAELSDVITVRGVAGAARDAIARKRFALEVTDVLSADEMGNLANANLTEALARLPGLNAVRNQATGEGDRITVRGLSSEYNAYSMNGVRLGGTGSPNDHFYRGVRLSFLSPDGVERITVRKTITPDADGDVIGGAIDIETPFAFDWDEPFTALSMEVHTQDRHDRGVTPAVSFALARSWDDRFGIYAGGFYALNRYGYDQIGDNGDHLPDRWYADSRDPDVDWDYDRFNTRGWELSQGLADVERYGVNGSVSWRGTDHTAHLRGQANRYVETGEDHRIALRHRTRKRSYRFSQIDPAFAGLNDPDQWQVLRVDEELGPVYGAPGPQGWQGSVDLSQIEDVDEDGLITQADAQCRSFYSVCGASGVYDPQDFTLARSMSATQLVGQAASLDLAGVSRATDRLTVEYALAYARSKEAVEYAYDLDFEAQTGPDAPASFLFDRPSIDIADVDPRFPYLQLSEAELNELHDLSLYEFDGLDIEHDSMTETLVQGRVDLDWQIERGAFESLQAGVKLTRSERRRLNAAPFYDEDVFETLTLADLTALYGPVVEGQFKGQYAGLNRLGQTLDADAVRAFVGADFSDLQGRPTQGFTYDETSQAAYVMGRWRWSDTDVLAGVRAEHVQYTVGGAYERLQADPDAMSLPPAPYTVRTSYSVVLPSVHLTRRFGRGWVTRGALWTSYARPPIERATQPISVDLINRAEPDPDSDPDDDLPPPDLAVSGVSIGNVNLSPSRAVHADLGLEWYRGAATSLSAALFYKHVDNFMVRRQSSVIRDGATVEVDLETVRDRLGLGDLPLTDDFTLSMADQGGLLELYGVELAARHTLALGPDWLQGFGGALTATYQTSEVETGLNWHADGYTTALFEAPEWLVGAELFWVRAGWEVYASWLYQSGFLEDYENYRHDPYEQPYTYVDLSVKRDLGDGLQASLDIQNLTDEPTYWYTFGEGEDRLREYRESGRRISLGLSWQF